MRITKTIYKHIIILALALIMTGAANAATTMEIGIPGLVNPGDPVSGVPEYIKYLYLFILGFVGIAGFASIVFWGAVWTASGVVDQKSRALEGIKNALYGIGIAFTAFIILNTINPDLTVIKAPSVADIKIIERNDKMTAGQIKNQNDNVFCGKLGVPMCIASSENGGGNGRCGTIKRADGADICVSKQEAICGKFTDIYTSTADPQRQGQAILDCGKQLSCQWIPGNKCIPNLK